MLNNPLIQRYRYSLMRPRQFWIYITIYIAVIALVLFINYTAYEYQGMFGGPTNFFESICYQFLILQVIILWGLGAVNSSSAIKDEIVGKSYDFFRMLPMSAGKKTIGILVGKNLVVLLLAGINFLLLIILGTLGQVDAFLLGQSFLVLISVAVLTSSTALLSSINPVSKKKKSSIVTLIILAFFLGPFLIQALIMAIWKIEELRNITGKFYTIELPIMILVSMVVLYFSCWTIKGILRKFTWEDESLVTRTGAYLFMLGYEFVLLGLFYVYLTEEARTINYNRLLFLVHCYWLLSLLPVLLIPFGSIRSFDKYLEHSGLIQSQSAGNKNTMSRMLLYSNLSLDLGLFAIWAAGSMGTTLITGLEFLHHLYFIFVLFSFYLFLILLLELYVVYTSLSNRIGLLLAFIAAVYVILPLILSGILESDIIFMHSPVGFFWEMFQKPHSEIAVLTSIWVINLILCIIPILLIWKRYLHILSTRRKM